MDVAASDILKAGCKKTGLDSRMMGRVFWDATFVFPHAVCRDEEKREMRMVRNVREPHFSNANMIKGGNYN